MGKIEKSQSNINYGFQTNLYDSQAPFAIQRLKELGIVAEEQNITASVNIPGLFKIKIQEKYSIYDKIGTCKSSVLGDMIEADGIFLVPQIALTDLGYHYMTFVGCYNSDKFSREDAIKTVYITLKDYLYEGQYTNILWYYQGPHGLSSDYITDLSDITVHDEAYPYITPDIDSYLKEYFESDENVLLLVGPPGTGKSKLIKKIISFLPKYKRMNSDDYYEDSELENQLEQRRVSVTYTTCQETLNDDGFFMRFLTGDSQLLVLEDIDLNLRSRKEGNSFMHKMLGTSDGIVNLSGKKIIMTTNISQLKDVDEALLRPGRTFDVLQFRALDLNEAVALANKIGVDLVEKPTGSDYTLAEIYNKKVNRGYDVGGFK